ncbi:MAG: XRE family transcriptional regulator [Chloroflexota bacterium]|nr:MAG: XRE family transcriptional regulator [Chloroflexota bacterium]
MNTENAKREGQSRYEEYWAKQMADPEFRRVYEEESSKKDLWLQLVEARQEAGLTQIEVARRLGVSQAQVARIEKRGYESYTLTTLRRYVQALGGCFRLDVAVHHLPHEDADHFHQSIPHS